LNKQVIKLGTELLITQCSNCTLIKNIQLELDTDANELELELALFLIN